MVHSIAWRCAERAAPAGTNDELRPLRRPP